MDVPVEAATAHAKLPTTSLLLPSHPPTLGPLVPEIVKLVTERDRIKEDVVNQLEKALEQAREGNVVAVAIAMVDKEGRGNYRWSEGDMATTMVGAVQRMQHMLNLAVDENVNWIGDTSDDPT